MAQVNRVATNRVIGLWAPYLPPWAVLVHRGRVSGKRYRTPVAAFVRGGTVAVAVAYGEESDWLRNVLAAGGGELVRRGTVRRLVNPRVVDRSQSGNRRGAPRRLLLADLA